MIAMIFEFWINPNDKTAYDAYLHEAAQLRPLLPSTEDGFYSIERFESLSEPGKFVSIGFFQDEEAVSAWRNTPEHRRAQGLGRAKLFKDYRLRMAEVLRDYSKHKRNEAPMDSRRTHDNKEAMKEVSNV